MVLEVSTVFTLVGGVRIYHGGYPWAFPMFPWFPLQEKGSLP